MQLMDRRGLLREELAMTDARKEGQGTDAANAEEAASKAQRPDPGAMRGQPYAAPRLRYLGSVRELTLGSAGAAPDGDDSRSS